HIAVNSYYSNVSVTAVSVPLRVPSSTVSSGYQLYEFAPLTSIGHLFFFFFSFFFFFFFFFFFCAFFFFFFFFFLLFLLFSFYVPRLFYFVSHTLFFS